MIHKIINYSRSSAMRLVKYALICSLSSTVLFGVDSNASSPYDTFWQTTTDTTYKNTEIAQCEGYDVAPVWERAVLNSPWGPAFRDVIILVMATGG